MIQAVIFDIDGTLVDSVDLHAHAWQDAFDKFGKCLDFQDVRNQIGKGGDQIIPTFLSEAETEMIGEQMKQYRSQVFKKNYLSRVKPFPKVKELFERLKKDDFKIAMGSSAHKEELEHYVELCGIADFVDVATSADDTDKSKPHPDIFEAALQKLGETPDRTVVVGDSPYDAQAATQIQLRTIGVLCGGFPREWLEKAGAFSIFKSPADLLKNYDSSPFKM